MASVNAPHVKVTVINAHNLAAADSNGKSDPFVKLFIINGATKQKGPVQKTKTVKMTLSPFWNETFILPLDESAQLEHLRLVLQVFDFDTFGKDDELGETVVDLDTHIDSQGLTRTKEQDLREPAGTDSMFDKFLGAKDVQAKGTLSFSYSVVSEEFLKVSKNFQFGVELTSPALKMQQVAGYEHEIPTVLVLIKQALKEKNAFNTEGIFTHSTKKKDVEKLRRQLDLYMGQFVLANATNDVHILAALLKNWFSSCPTRVLAKLDARAAVKRTSDEFIKANIETLDQPNRSIFLWLADTILECVHSPKDAKSMGVAVGQNIMREPDPSLGAEAAMQEAKYANRFFVACMQYRLKSAVSRAKRRAENAKAQQGNASDKLQIIVHKTERLKAELAKLEASQVEAQATFDDASAVVAEAEAQIEAIMVKVEACIPKKPSSGQTSKERKSSPFDFMDLLADFDD